MAQDVLHNDKMAEDQWLLKEDGYLNADTDLNRIVYHPTLNVILICTRSGVVRVLDVNSGVVLQSSCLAGKPPAVDRGGHPEVVCKYVPGQDRILFCDGQAIGVRSDYNGVLLLDSILQKPVTNTRDDVKLELLLSEAIILKQSLSTADVAKCDEVLNHITERVNEAQQSSRKGIKAQKWNTVCLELPLDDLRTFAGATVSDLLLKNQHTPELAVTSAVQERLSELAGEQVTASDRKAMASEAKRRETFTFWPHMDYKWALPDQMAQAGFYHQPNSSGDDRAMCFTCNVCLVSWERTDEPWSEHERHSPSCAFVMGEYTQNVPLSVTLATNPAIDATYRGFPVKVLGTSSVTHLFPTANEEGLISVFDISGKLKRTHNFFVTHFDSPILDKFTQDFGVPGSWNDYDDDEVKCATEKRVTALSIVGEKPTKNPPNNMEAWKSEIRPTIICGLNIRCKNSKHPLEDAASVESLNNQNKESAPVIIMDVDEEQQQSEVSCLYLVIYDFQYKKEYDDLEYTETVAVEPKIETGELAKPFKWSELTSVANDTQMDTVSNASDDASLVKENEIEPCDLYAKFMKGMMTYQTPGDSSDLGDLLLPTALNPKQHSGPRALHVENSETDSAQASLFTPHNLTFINSSTDSGKSISDYINELKNCKVGKKLNYSRAVQCVPLPVCYKVRKDLEISDIIPTTDNRHVLVVLRSESRNSVLLVYSLNFGQKMVRLNEEPLLIKELGVHERPLEVSMLSQLERSVTGGGSNNSSGGGGGGGGGSGGENTSEGGPEGTTILVCADGAVRILDVATLQVVSVAKSGSEKFVSAAYCNSLDRLCASTEKGSLHFYTLNDGDNESSEDHDDDDLFGLNAECSAGGSTSQAGHSEPVEGEELAACFHDPGGYIDLNDLKKLHTLCTFEPLKAGYCTVVPACWSEMQQVQRQRRQPQSLQSEGEPHIKTWRLQTDTTTWDEHTFEIALPTPAFVGHVDVHFTLHASTAPPHVEITLLRQNTSGIGHKKDVKFAVDDTVTFEALQWTENPVTSQEYLRAHNADILAGPINIAANLDLSEQKGCVTLTSPKLYKSRNRILLLHMKAIYSKDEVTKGNIYKKRSFESRSSSSISDSSRKTEFYLGCDCLHEVSVMIYTTKHTDIPHERSHRTLMLESNSFIHSLAQTAVDMESVQVQHLVLDVLNWIASIRLARNRNCNGESPPQQLEFLKAVKENLGGLIQRCMLEAGRSISHKCVKLLVLCSSGARNINDTAGSQFDTSVLNTFLDILDSIHQVKSSGSLQWLVVLLFKVAQTDNISVLTTKCVSLLTHIACELHKRTNPHHLLLRSRYGLYGTPLEPELFDIEPPPPGKPSSTQVTYASVVSGESTTQQADFHANYSFYREHLDAKDVLSTANNDMKVRLKNVTPMKMVRGLLETEPLHYTCAAASDGTRIERADATSGSFISSMVPFTTNLNNQVAEGGSGTKKEDADHHVFKCELKGVVMNNNTKNEKAGVNGSLQVKNMIELMAFDSDNVKQDVDFSKLISDTLEMAIESDKKAKAASTSQANKTFWCTDDLTSSNSQSVPWQQLLIAPTQQVIVVERMHSGARRHVTLDFGQPILLTDVLIPYCHDLVFLNIDLWLKGEDVDGIRLVVASDIGSRNLILNDLQPPPLCRYLKITAVGRYGMSTSRCKIPIGYFYGHLVILPEDIPPEQTAELQTVISTDLDKHLTVLSKLYEDVSCRYSLACSKLKDLLHPYLMSDIPNSSHLSAYMSIMRDKTGCMTDAENSKIFNAYQEAVTYQRQLNMVRSVMFRIEGGLNRNQKTRQTNTDLSTTCSDKLRSIAESLLDILLSLETTPEIDLETCKQLFQGLCISQSSRLQFFTAILLDRSCGRKPYWGAFLADTVAQMFSSSYNVKFPQDRVFILLSYLSRKTPEKSVVLDATLKVIAQVLLPLAEPKNNLLAVTVDLTLLGWLLMFLALQLDLAKSSVSGSTRWDWVSGEMGGKGSADSASNGLRKKLHKRFMQYKQQLDNLDWTQKIVQTSVQVQALSALSNHAANLTSKLEAAIKNQENFLKKIKQYKSKDGKPGDGENGKGGGGKRRREVPESANERQNPCLPPRFVDSSHSLAVAKGLLALVLAMDHSCSADLFLLSCKAISRLVTMSKFRLGQLVTEPQLLKLIHMCIESQLSWAPHALACLLQDILDLVRPPPFTADMETESSNSASTSWGNPDLLSDVESICESFGIEEITEPAAKQGKNNNNNTNNNSNGNQLPSVYESEDSELEDFLDDILERGRSILKKTNKTVHTTCTGSYAMDSRLEMGVETSSEIILRKLLMLSSHNLMQNVNSGWGSTENEVELPQWSPNLILPWQLQPQCNASYRTMLMNCFDALFENIQNQSGTNLEHVLQLWLMLNCSNAEEKFDASAIPFIGLSPEAVSALVSAIAWSPGLSLRTWCTALQTLTLVCNLPHGPPNSSQWTDMYGLYRMTSYLVNHTDFVQMLIRLLSGTGLLFSDKGLVGPSLCKALHDFLVRINMRCDVVTPSSRPGGHLKTLLLKVVYQLVQPMGPLASRRGPLDAQCKLLQGMVYLDYSNADLSIAMSILESMALLVYSYVTAAERIKCVSVGEKASPTSPSPSCFRGLFGPVLGAEGVKQDRPASWESLLVTLLKLLGKLVRTPLPSNGEQQEAMDTEPSSSTSQTDESKAEQIQQDTLRNTPSIPCLADTVLQHHPTIIRLCQALAACKASSLSMLANISLTQQATFAELGEPTTVGDAVFQVLAALARKASQKELIMDPLLIFLSQAPQLSEPLVWFVLQVLSTEEALRSFLSAGGITILARSLVVSSSAPSTISQTGLISMVMQHFSGVSAKSDAHTAITASTTSKKLQQASIENNQALVNFAPFGSIRCPSGTAQPADVLIQGGAATHRRARTPQWSYHFYPEEFHTELTLQLPSAILLREVHLQPHLSALATCPSAVALEVSAEGPSRLVPACPPLPTSGMTFIRLHLPIPEVVNCVQLRLYKPRDANNISLSQIRLLGTSAFGNNARPQQIDLTDDESHCKHSLGWLRLLHHCFTLPRDPDLCREIVATTAQVPDLLATCCGLLLVPSHIPPLYMPNLEKVLCELSLYDRDNGLNAMKVLLESRSNSNEPLGSSVVNLGSGPMFLRSAGCQSACELLYEICSHQDGDTSYRVSLMLEWLQNVAERALVSRNTDICSPMYISAIASILWSAKQNNVSYNLNEMITEDLFWAAYQLQTIADDSLKYALDSLLCSMCHIRPELFPRLLRKFGIQTLPSGTETNARSMTDDIKQTYENDSESRNQFLKKELLELNFTERQFETIALVSRSPTAIQQLLDSGLPKTLTSIILEFCSSKSKNNCQLTEIKYVTDILKFFADLSDEKPMRDWLGSVDGSSFWFFLLMWLCEDAATKEASVQSEAHAQLEEICVKFLSKCCLCHPQNQEKLATVLCKVIHHNNSGISGFMRRLILQLLLENEKIPVSIKADETLYKNSVSSQACFPVHPAHKQTHDRALLYLSTNTTLAEIMEQHISFTVSLKPENSTAADKDSSSKNETNRNICTIYLSMAAGVTAKDKRSKDAKNQMMSTPQFKKKRFSASESSFMGDVVEGRIITCDAVPDQPLPLSMSLAHVLRLVESNGVTSDWPCVHLTICQNRENSNQTELDASIFKHPFSSALQVFSSMGGLALLAEHLPIVYPETVRPPVTEKPPTELSESDWVKVEGSDDIYEDLEVDSAGTSTSSKPSGSIPNVPPHSLTAFGLFLRLPGYAEVLLKDMKKALCLLRLVLGVTDDGEGRDIFQTPIADFLPTLPFKVLQKLYDSTPLSTDDGRLLRKISINIGCVHLILACLGVFTHQAQNNDSGSSQKDTKNKEDKSQLYWAKGTGFGTGSTQQSWNVEQALMKQKNEEEHVTVLLLVLASYINPGGEASEELSDNVLPSNFYQLLSNSVLLPALCSYLRNDSVLDMSRHIPLYRAALQVLRAIASSSQLVSLLVSQKITTGPSISQLLKNMKTCVDTYTSKLRYNNKAGGTKNSSKLGEQLEEMERDEGLALLMPDIQTTADLVCQMTDRMSGLEHDGGREAAFEKPILTSLEDKYLKVMKWLQFDTFEMIQELPEGGYKFVISHHFESNARSTGEQSHPARVKRLAQEAVTLATSLPLSYSSSVFVRCDTDRLDLMKVLITGPADTPYANGCFELDVFFPADYPLSPMLINLETTGHHSVRFNPNLYNDGKVCLSVLNTWHGRPEEKWNAQTSSFLQVLVSIQSLILVPEPYFNEPGYERSRGTPSGTQSSKEYNANVCQATVRWAMLEQIVNPCPCFKDVIHAHFYLKRDEVIQQVENWIKDLENDVMEKKTSRTSSKRSPLTNLDTFKKTFQQLKEKLQKLKPPDCLKEEIGEEEEAMSGVEVEHNEVDTDVEMEKLVNDMCE